MPVKSNRAVVPLALVCAFIASTPAPARGQILRDPGAVASSTSEPGAAVDAAFARRAQAEFERFHLENLPGAKGGRPAKCDEQVGNVCYWYNEKGPASARGTGRRSGSAGTT